MRCADQGMLVDAAQGHVEKRKHIVHMQLLLGFEVRRSRHARRRCTGPFGKEKNTLLTCGLFSTLRYDDQGMLVNAAQGHLEKRKTLCSHAVAPRLRGTTIRACSSTLHRAIWYRGNTSSTCGCFSTLRYDDQGMLVNAAQGYLEHSETIVHMPLLLDIEVRRSGMLVDIDHMPLLLAC